jgi:hypothetical protein
MDRRQGLKDAAHYIEMVQAILTEHVKPDGPGERDTITAHAGREVAMNVARILVVYLKRAGGQSQFSVLLAAQLQQRGADALCLRNFARAYVAKRGPGRRWKLFELTRRGAGLRKRMTESNLSLKTVDCDISARAF